MTDIALPTWLGALALREEPEPVQLAGVLLNHTVCDLLVFLVCLENLDCFLNQPGLIGWCYRDPPSDLVLKLALLFFSGGP